MTGALKFMFGIFGGWNWARIGAADCGICDRPGAASIPGGAPNVGGKAIAGFIEGGAPP
jgi:hypothetical protein